MPATISSSVVLFCIGAISLACIYHSVLFLHRRSSLLGCYCVYLWTLTIYLIYRIWMAAMQYPIAPCHIPFLNINISVDDTLMWPIYISYVRFWENALQIKKTGGRFARSFYSTAVPLIIAYIIFENIAVNIPMPTTANILYICIRVYLGCFGLYITLLALKKRKNYYYNYLAGGSITIIVSSLISTYVFFFLNARAFQISPFGWLMIGYFIEIIFFSAAIGYRLKEESAERVAALRKVIDQQAAINRLEMERMKAIYEAREEERSRISAELHDDLGSGLSTIKLMSEMACKPHLDVSSNYLEFISRKSQELIENINEIIWSLSNKADSLGGMIAYIRQYAFNYLEPTAIALSFSAPDHVEHIEINPTIRRQIFLLSKECLHNILKHSHATKVTIDIVLHEKLALRISDNGTGIPQNAPKGNGLQNMKMRVEKINGCMTIHSGKGTSIVFHIPLNAAYNQSAISNTRFKV